MKLVLENNFVREVEKPTKEQNKGVKYNGFTEEGEQIELFDMEANKIAPIVRFLAEGKKNKISWLLILGAGFAIILLFALIMYIMWPNSVPESKIVDKVALTPINNTKPIAEVVKTETETETEKQTSWSLEMANEVDMFEDMKREAEMQTLKLTYENQRLVLENEEKQKEIKKLTNLVNNLEQENLILSTRKSEGATDDFIYYLGDSVYKTCKKPTTEVAIEKCKTLYFNYLEYGKNR